MANSVTNLQVEHHRRDGNAQRLIYITGIYRIEYKRVASTIVMVGRAVQLVRIPIQAVDDQETASAPWLQFRQIKGTRITIERLVDDYMVAQFARRWA